MIENLSQDKHLDISFLPEKKAKEITASLTRGMERIDVDADIKLIERFLITKMHPEWNRS